MASGAIWKFQHLPTYGGSHVGLPVSANLWRQFTVNTQELSWQPLVPTEQQGSALSSQGLGEKELFAIDMYIPANYVTSEGTVITLGLQYSETGSNDIARVWLEHGGNESQRVSWSDTSVHDASFWLLFDPTPDAINQIQVMGLSGSSTAKTITAKWANLEYANYIKGAAWTASQNLEIG